MQNTGLMIPLGETLLVFLLGFVLVIYFFLIQNKTIQAGHIQTLGIIYLDLYLSSNKGNSPRLRGARFRRNI